jgi:hypothetical protein
MVRRLSTILGAMLVAGSTCAEDVTWRPATPLLTTGQGEVIEIGRELDWSSPKGEPAAKLGPLLPLSRPAPEGTGRPHDLPGMLTEVQGPTLPAPSTLAPVMVIPSAEPPKRALKATFGSEVPTADAKPSMAAPVSTYVPAKESVQPSRPQPWAPRPGQRTILSDFFARPSR